jgi:hypothetical protein
MAEIIDLNEKKRQEKGRRAALERSKRMETVLQTIQCSNCAMKCTKCGTQLGPGSSESDSPITPYRLCPVCLEEYHEFLARLHGQGNAELYWHNQEWMEVWKAWMHYQEALKRYELSEGFRRLLEELKGT